MTEPEPLGTLIRTSRLERDLSLGQLASAVGRSPSSVRRWERGEAAPSADVISDLAAVLGLDEEDLGARAASAHPQQGAAEPAPSPDVETGEDAVVPVVAPRAKTTIEDEDVVVEAPSYFETPVPVAPQPVQREPSRYGRASSAVWGRRDLWIGWLRGFLTILALVFLAMGLMWAGGELLAALKDVLGSFSTGA